MYYKCFRSNFDQRRNDFNQMWWKLRYHFTITVGLYHKALPVCYISLPCDNTLLILSQSSKILFLTLILDHNQSIIDRTVLSNYIFNEQWRKSHNRITLKLSHQQLKMNELLSMISCKLLLRVRCRTSWVLNVRCGWGGETSRTPGSRTPGVKPPGSTCGTWQAP